MANTNFIHSRELLDGGDVVEVKITHQCYVRLMDDGNFQKYKNGFKYDSIGGHFTKAPIRITVPHYGYWNVTVDLGGKSAAGIKYSIGFLRKK